MTNTIEQDRVEFEEVWRNIIGLAYGNHCKEAAYFTWQLCANSMREKQVGEALGELRCDASTGHNFGVYWYNNAPAIGTKIFINQPQPKTVSEIRTDNSKVIASMQKTIDELRFELQLKTMQDKDTK